MLTFAFRPGMLKRRSVMCRVAGGRGRLWCSNNHIPNIGEGMAMVDLSGTDVEPVFLGSGAYAQEPQTFQMFVQECVADLADNRGSSFRGPRSYFYEGQFTLRARDK